MIIDSDKAGGRKNTHSSSQSDNYSCCCYYGEARARSLFYTLSEISLLANKTCDIPVSAALSAKFISPSRCVLVYTRLLLPSSKNFCSHSFSLISPPPRCIWIISWTFETVAPEHLANCHFFFFAILYIYFFFLIIQAINYTTPLRFISKRVKCVKCLDP